MRSIAGRGSSTRRSVTCSSPSSYSFRANNDGLGSVLLSRIEAVTKRKDILAQMARYAKEQNVEMTVKEGSSHTRIWIGQRYTTLPRHKEIPDPFARKILRDVGINKGR